MRVSSSARRDAACRTHTAATDTMTAGTSATSGAASARPATSSALMLCACPRPPSVMGRGTAGMALMRHSAQVRGCGRGEHGTERLVTSPWDCPLPHRPHHLCPRTAPLPRWLLCQRGEALRWRLGLQRWMGRELCALHGVLGPPCTHRPAHSAC